DLVCPLCASGPPVPRPPREELPAVGALAALLAPFPPRVADPAAQAPATRTLPTLPGYEGLAFLGEGGMGRVYKARQGRADRRVPLKMLKAAGLDGDEGLRARFQTEARLAATLQHPHIVPIYEVGEHDGQPFFSLELCAGSLEEKLAETPLPPGE